ncbi:MAG: MazG nucleotide pyrophosphohydrolase domain-containing protein [Ruthenibacterium lactatiformans]
MNGLTQKERYNMEDLLEIVALLRIRKMAARGIRCRRIRPSARILSKRLRSGGRHRLADASLLCEELGDVLLGGSAHAYGGRTGGVHVRGRLYGHLQKLIYRHPHIFGDAGAQTPDEALQKWEALKRREKHREGAGDDLDSVPAACRR